MPEECIRVIDGDDIVWMDQRYRLHGYDAPEISNFRSKIDKDLERRRGYQAMLRLKTLISQARTLHLISVKPDPVFAKRRIGLLLIDGWDTANWAIGEGWGVRFEDRKKIDWGDPTLPFPKLPLPPAIEAEEEDYPARVKRGGR